MRRPRFTIRWLMALVVIAALSAWGAHLLRWRAQARKLAGLHRDQETIYSVGERMRHAEVQEREGSISSFRQQIADAEGKATRAEGREKRGYESLASLTRRTMELEVDMLGSQRKELARYSALREYHSELASKYESAARHPWLPVALDPPPPE